MTTTTDNATLVKRFYELGIGGNLPKSDLDQYFAPDFHDHNPPGPVPPGIDGVVLVQNMLAQAMPERTITIHDLIEHGFDPKTEAPDPYDFI